MLENMTYENILNDMLSRVTKDVDKREGSIIYDALAPCAYQLSQFYFMLSNYIDLFFVDTAAGEYLDRKASDYGLQRKPATPAKRKIETTGPVEIGTRWGYQNTTYVINEMISENAYSATCMQAGEIGNVYSGMLDNIDNAGNVTAALTSILMSGANEEPDSKLRERIRQYISNPAQDGNVTQYLRWAAEYPGIGAAKVFPLWNGANTVKVAITNGLYQPAEPELVNNFQKYMDPNSDGLGNGAAPIGCKVTVVSGVRKDINVTADIVLTEGYTEPAGAAEAISKYLSLITYQKNSVNYMRIGSALLDCLSIAELNNLTVNGAAADILLEGDEIPVLNSLNLAVVS